MCVWARVMTDEGRQTRILQLNSKLVDAHGQQLGSGGPTKDPPGFWEGALQNKELSDAHDKFMSDIEVLHSTVDSIRIYHSFFCFGTAR